MQALACLADDVAAGLQAIRAAALRRWLRSCDASALRQRRIRVAGYGAQACVALPRFMAPRSE